MALVKPQFEAGRGQVPGGVVRDPAVHRATIERVVNAARDMGLVALNVVASPILGPEGNREFLLHLGVPGPSRGPAPDRTAGQADLSDRIAVVTEGAPA